MSEWPPPTPNPNYDDPLDDLDRFPNFEGGPRWTDDYGFLARSMGWDVFASHGSVNGPWQIQHLDEGPLESDEEAWRIVWSLAHDSTTVLRLLGKRALEFIAYHNRVEYDSIVRTMEEEPDHGQQHPSKAAG